MKKYRILRQSVIFSIIFCSLLFSINAASAADKTYYWIPSSGVIDSSGFTANWGSCNAQPTSYRITTLSSTGFTCSSDRLTTTSSGDQFLAIFPTAYSSDAQITGKTGATFYLSSQRSGYTATYRFDLGYAISGTFTSLGYVTQSVESSSGRLYTIDLGSISGTAPSGSYLALKVSVTTSRGGRVYLGTNGGSTGSNSGRFYVSETVSTPPAPTYNVSINASPASTDITAGSSYTYNITVNNTGDTNGDYTLAVSDSDSTNFVTPSVLGRTSIYVPARSSNTTTLEVTARSTAAGGASDITTVTATSIQNPSYASSTTATTTIQSPVYSVSASNTSPAQTGGQIQVATNRQVILDDPSGWVSSVGDQWNDESTTIRWYVLVLNSSGLAVPAGVSVNTYLKYPNGTVFYSAIALTDSNGYANFSANLNNINNIITPWNVEGYWSVNATATVNSQSISNNGYSSKCLTY